MRVKRPRQQTKEQCGGHTMLGSGSVRSSESVGDATATGLASTGAECMPPHRFAVQRASSIHRRRQAPALLASLSGLVLRLARSIVSGSVSDYSLREREHLGWLK